jgi:hypothetical protein
MINDSSEKIVFFSDDLVIFSESDKGLQNALYKLQKYCFDWQLTVNINKTKILTFQKTYKLKAIENEKKISELDNMGRSPNYGRNSNIFHITNGLNSLHRK